MRLKATTGRSGVVKICLGHLLPFIVFGWLSGSALAQPAVTVGVSILPERYFVERIAGNYANVIVLVGPGYSPATYEPKPRQLSQLQRARLFFLIGVPFEARWTETFSSINPAMRLISLSRDIELMPLAIVHGSPGRNMADDHHAHDGALDPHVWLSPPLVKQMALIIKTELVALDSGHRDVYDANYRQFITELDELDQWIREQLATVRQRRFLVFHPSWSYYAREYGLQQVSIEHQGKQPAAKSLNNVIEIAKQQQIKVIFVQRQFSQRDAKTIARQIDAQVVQVDPLAENYFENLRYVTQRFVEALQ